MLIGYARTSTVDQAAGYAAQIEALERAGCEKVFREQVSAVARQRPELEAAMEFAREGDVLIVTKLDRLARSVAQLVEITKALEAILAKTRDAILAARASGLSIRETARSAGVSVGKAHGVIKEAEAADANN